jgi:predicted DNA-binding ribbon-helix-helix protein
MRRLFAHRPQRDHESQTRSLRIGGHCTSIRLELAFWRTLEEIATKEGMSLAKLLTKLHSEVLEHHGEVKNFASLLRCSCLIYRSRPPVAVMPELRGSSAQIVLDAAE